LTPNVLWTRIFPVVRTQVFQQGMLRNRQIVVVPMMVVATTLCWATDSKSHHKPANASEGVQIDVTPALATQEQFAPRLTPEQMPPQPPQVSYLNGELLVIAHGSTLADILSAVSRQTGAVIDVPPGSGGERVVGRTGPGPARDVLAALLNGSQYDYVIVASFPNPARVEHVVLISRSNALEGTAPVNNPAIAVDRPEQHPFSQIVPETKVVQQQTTAEADAEDETSEDDSEPTTEQISEAQEPPAADGVVLPAPQAFPQPIGSNPQQPANGAAPPPGSPNPLPPH
jgi:hypothetical protein